MKLRISRKNFFWNKDSENTYTTKCHNFHSYTSLKPGARTVFHILRVGTGAQTLGPSAAAAPDTLAGRQTEVEQLRLDAMPVWAVTPLVQITCKATVLVPLTPLLMQIPATAGSCHPPVRFKMEFLVCAFGLAQS